MESTDPYTGRKKKHSDHHNLHSELKQPPGVLRESWQLQCVSREDTVVCPASASDVQGQPGAAGHGAVCGGSVQSSTLSATNMGVRVSASTTGKAH